VNIDTVCYYYEYSDASCTNQVQSYSLSMQNCMAGDADDDGYVMQIDSGINFLYQQFVAQQEFPAPLPGTSTILRFVLIEMFFLFKLTLIATILLLSFL